ncbi:MAG: putative metal-dependent hydrolase [Ignavibacteriales bacterium]|nr:putative metal-dependent hydrolase [Ignavibacteriales bacterium]
MTDLQYPVGKFQPKSEITDDERQQLIRQISEAPAKMRGAVKGLSKKQLDTPYRPAGWTVRQVVHHVPDSHLNAYIRFKLGITENHPTIKPYEQELWSELPDARTASIDVSLDMLESLHKRWVLFLKSLKPSDFARTINHPESGVQNLDRVLQLYAWHGRHHTAHITTLRERMGWNKKVSKKKPKRKKK